MMGEPGRRREWLPVLGLFCGVLFLFFYRCTMLGEYFSPASLLKDFSPWVGAVKGGHFNSLRSDDVFLAFPLYTSHFNALLQGQIPFWDPWKLGGALGGMGWVSLGQLLYPLSFVFLFEPHGPMLFWFAALRLLVGGLGMWALLRHLKVSSFGSVFGGIAYLLTGSFVVWLSSPIPSVMIFLPWAILAIEALIARPTLLAFAGLVLAGGSQFLAGYIAESFVFMATAGVYGLVRLLVAAPRLGWAQAMGRLAILALAVGFSTLVGALGLFPSLTALQGAPIAGRGAGLGSLIPLNAIVYLVPDFFGNPATGRWWYGANYCELVAYCGLLPLFFALGAVIVGWKDRLLWPFLVPLFVIVGYVYGLPGLKELGHLPGFYQTATTRWTAAIAFLVAALGGLGWDLLTRRPRLLFGLWVAFVAAAVAALVAAYVHVWPTLDAQGLKRYGLGTSGLFVGVVLFATPTFVALYRRGRLEWRYGAWLVTVLVLDLGIAGADFNPTASPSTFYATTPGIARLQVDREEGRILPYEGSFLGDTPSVYELASLTGYDIRGDRPYQRFLYEAGDRSFSPDKALTPNAYLMATVGPGRTEPNVLLLNVATTSPLLDLLAVRHMVAPAKDDRFPARMASYDGPDMRVFDNPHARPWAWWTGKARVVSDEAAYEAMRSAPRGGPVEALLAEAPADVPLENAGTGEVRILERQVGAMRLQVEATSAGFVMVSDRFDPGWHATVDGRPVKPVRADAILYAVPVPAGKHAVTLSFQPPVAVGSFWLSAVGLLVFAVLALVGWRRGRRTSHGIVGL